MQRNMQRNMATVSRAAIVRPSTASAVRNRQVCILQEPRKQHFRRKLTIFAVGIPHG